MISLFFKPLTSGKFSSYIVCDYPKFYHRKYKKLNILLSKDYSKSRKIAPQDKQLLEEANRILLEEKKRLFLVLDTDPSLTSFIQKWILRCGKSHRNQLIMHLNEFCAQENPLYNEIDLKWTQENPLYNEIDLKWMDRFKEYLGGKLSQSTVATLLKMLNTCYNKAVVSGAIQDNPVKDYDYPVGHMRERVYLEDDQVKRLIQSDAPIKAIIRDTFLFSLFSGIRFDDIRDLSSSQVTMMKNENGNVTGYELTLSRSRGKNYTVGLNAKASAIFSQYYHPSLSKVFTGMPHLPFFNSKLHLWAAWAGVDKSVSFSVARHTFIIGLLKEGIPLPKVRKVVGFGDTSDVYIYERMVKGL
jgi:site-specific recombinase XerD